MIKRHTRRQQAIDLLGGSCVACGSAEKLQFDHVMNDREDYQHTIGYMLQHSWEKLAEELNRCQLLCFPCHDKKSKSDRGFMVVEHGRANCYNGHGCRCDDCRAAWSVYIKQRRMVAV
jgi:5-methylcytosine-specific restriction endonuclease McrA